MNSPSLSLLDVGQPWLYADLGPVETMVWKLVSSAPSRLMAYSASAAISYSAAPGLMASRAALHAMSASLLTLWWYFTSSGWRP